MKELNLEEKARRYDEAIEVARKIKNGEPINVPDGTLIPVAIFPELKGSEDERIRKALIQIFNVENFEGYNIKNEEVIAWLEKQGEKSDNHVEPKFKVGDYVVGKYISGYISEVRDDCYLLDYQGFSIDKQDNYHLWTIKDAKDGDVLQLGEVTAIFKKFIGRGHCRCYCSVCDGEFEIPSQDGGDNDYGCDNAIPATKEQWKRLEKAITEAGYTFDFEKKELKHIAEPINGEDFGIDGLWHAQRILEETLGSVDGYQTDDGILEHKCAISAVKKLYGQKPSWSEEDKKMIDDAIGAIGAADYYTYDDKQEIENWLKFLKERYTWKPSDEQMEVLYKYAEQNSYDGAVLTSLYNDIKKLK